jgi:opacity protein-like surface antigen
MCEFLVGIEADIGFSDADGKNSTAIVEDFNLNPNGHLRARLGLPLGRVMPFVAAGLAVAEGDLNVTTEPPSDSQFHLGFSGGGGIDVRVMDNLLLRGEYIYDTYDSQTYHNFYDHKVDLDTHTIRAAIIWQF